MLLLLWACAPTEPATAEPSDPVTSPPTETGAPPPTETPVPTELPRIRGRFESGGPVRTCGEVANVGQGDDGVLIRASLDLCGDDMDALAATLVQNLDAMQAQQKQALIVVGQGTQLPDSWLTRCETYALDSGGFVGDLCVPWDPHYQQDLAAALGTLGTAIGDHPALAGVYFTISTMTNGSELHFRVDRSTFTPVDDAVLTGAYLDVMDQFQQAFEVPIVFEAGHCLFDLPGVDPASVDCATPLALYRHTRDTYGTDAVGLALWNCAERFWYGPGSSEEGVRPLLEEATADGVAMGCQTVGNFTEQPCRFTDPAVGDYGTRIGVGRDLTCEPAGPDDAERACTDTLGWFAGTRAASADSLVLQGTWVESWTADVAPDGINRTSPSCAAALDAFADQRGR